MHCKAGLACRANKYRKNQSFVKCRPAKFVGRDMNIKNSTDDMEPLAKNRTTSCQIAAGLFALLWALLLPSPTLQAHPPPDPAVIRALAADAYLWGLGPEAVYRLSKYNTIIGAPYNTIKYGAVPAAWNNQATNAGDASVVYIAAFTNFDKSQELVFTVPPTTPVPPFTYYVAAYYDVFGNDIGSIGTRTTPSETMTSYLLVGPQSPYAKRQMATIHGYTYPVMASDTNLNWFLIRILANTLI